MFPFSWFSRRKSAPPPPVGFDFPAAAALMARRINGDIPRTTGEGGGILIPILPWRLTAVPFFSLEIGLALASTGAEVRFLGHSPDLPFHRHDHYSSEQQILRRLLKSLGEGFQVEHIDGAGGDESLSDDMLELWTNENAVWLNRSETVAYGTTVEEEAVEGMGREYARVHDFLYRNRPEMLFLPGGVMGGSVCYVEACRRLGIPFATYDSGRGEIKLCIGGVAAHNDDLPEAFRFFSQRPEEEQSRFCALAEDWIARRRQGEDDHALQLQNTPPFPRKDFLLLCLNYRADSAAIMRQKLFPTVNAWLFATARWAVENRVELVVRQHPCERLERWRGNDDWTLVLRDADPSGEFVHFISAYDPVNTYELIERAAAVLPFTSRVGVEGAMLGRPVITSTRAFYANLGFTHDPADADEYFSLLKSASRGELAISPEQRKAAALAYFAISEHT
ncbi:MAG: hypothetical protein ACREKL_01865, partial [Chthoniobacterales bacterium]